MDQSASFKNGVSIAATILLKLNLASSNLPENPQGPPSLYYELNTTVRHKLIAITVYVLFEIILKFNCVPYYIGG